MSLPIENSPVVSEQQESKADKKLHNHKNHKKNHNNKKRKQVAAAVEKAEAAIDAPTAQLAKDLRKNPNSKIQLFALRLVPSDHPSYNVPAGSVLRISNIALDAKNTVINSIEPATSLLLTVANTPIQKFTIGSVSASNAGSTVVDFYVPGPAKVEFEVQGNQVICVNGFQLTNVAPEEFVERAAKRQKTEEVVAAPTEVASEADNKEDVEMSTEGPAEAVTESAAEAIVVEETPAVVEAAAPAEEAAPAQASGKKNKKNKNKNKQTKVESQVPVMQAEEPKPVVEEEAPAVEEPKDVEMIEEAAPVVTPESVKEVVSDKKSNKKNKKNKNKQQKDGEPSPAQAPVVPETPVRVEELKESAPITPEPVQADKSSKKNKKQKNKKEGESSPVEAPVAEKVEVTPEGKASKKTSEEGQKKSQPQQQPGASDREDVQAKAKESAAKMMLFLEKRRSRSKSVEGRKYVRA